MGDYLDDMAAAGDPEAIREQARRQGAREPLLPESLNESDLQFLASQADFMARQIVDDLYRAGVDARFQQHIVEQTIRDWFAGSGRKWGR